MNFETYLQTVKLRCRPLPPAKQLIHAQIGMITELGELGDLLKRELAYGKEFDRINLMEECGDFLWYFVLYCDERAIHTRFLDEIVTECESAPRVTEGDEGLFRVLTSSAAMLVAREHLEISAGDERDMAKGSLMLIYALLSKYDFTMAQCLVANDAKLELRTGKKFDADRILNRDTEAERKLLEEHGQAEPRQAAG